MSLLTFNSKYIVQSQTAVTTTSNSLQDDTQAEQIFSLGEISTVLVMYQANSNYGSTNPTSGIQNAINVDSTDYANQWDSGNSGTRSVRNVCFWIGSLASGSHTIKGRFASNTNGSTATIDNRILLIYVLDGNEFQYVDNSTTVTTSSMYTTEDSNASVTFTPSATCKALFLYGCSNSGATEHVYGKTASIKVGSTYYSKAEKTPYYTDYPDSIFTCHASSLTSASTTVKGGFSSNIDGSTVTINRRQLGVLLFDDSTLLDIIASDTQVSTTSDSLVDDTQATISRTTTENRELLVVGMGTKRHNTYSGSVGECYGIKTTSDKQISRGSPGSASSYGNSVATCWAETDAAGSQTVQGRFSNNYSTYSAKIDSRCIVALWFGETTPEIQCISQSPTEVLIQEDKQYISQDITEVLMQDHIQRISQEVIETLIQDYIQRISQDITEVLIQSDRQFLSQEVVEALIQEDKQYISQDIEEVLIQSDRQYISQISTEVLIKASDQHLSQVSTEILVQSDKQYISQSSTEVLIQADKQHLSQVSTEVLIKPGTQRISQETIEVLFSSKVSIQIDYDTRQLIYVDPTKFTFVSQEFMVCINEEQWTTTTSSSGIVEIYNIGNIGCLPKITLTISTTYNNNPILRIYNGSVYKDISLGTSIGVDDSYIVIDSEERHAKKNLVYFLPSSFPQINNNEYFSVEFINNGSRVAIPIDVYYKSYDINSETIIFKSNVTMQNVLSQIDTPKDYYNLSGRNKYITSNEVSFEFERKMITDYLDQIVNSTKTYRVEIYGLNYDDGSQKIYRLGNVTFNNINVSIPESDLITNKISGTGILL